MQNPKSGLSVVRFPVMRMLYTYIRFYTIHVMVYYKRAHPSEYRRGNSNIDGLFYFFYVFRLSFLFIILYIAIYVLV